jgi:hypothetical protein|tara:strand:+ start:188 stop:712 length:525 start_codon:yes stop_codon:yes gene_type:complete
MEKFKKNINSVLFVTFVIFCLSFTRLIPHAWNFSPMIAAGLFSGFYFRQFYLSSFIVIFSMFIGDLFLGFHDTMIFTYFSLIVAVLIGLNIKNLNFRGILYTSLMSSVSFFLITNFGAWLTLEMYTKNFSGLIESYIMAIPFFQNTLISTFIYLFIFKIFFDFAVKKKVLRISF